MKAHRRITVSLLSLLVIVSALLLPMSASAGKWLHERGRMNVPPNATEEYKLTVGDFGVTIFPGCLPEGGPVMLHVFTGPDGEFRAQFTPERTFEAPIMMDFGTATEVVYNASGGDIVYVTSDLDGDGEVGEIMIDHFSRYSGWH